MSRLQNLLQLSDSTELLPAGKPTGGHDRLSELRRAILADGVEVVESEADRIHQFVARRTNRVAGMQVQHLTKSRLAVRDAFACLFDTGDVRRWIIRSDTQEVLENKQSAPRWRSSIRV